ncbi:hypothetical protein RHMOL_Rhmol04G0273700 [Rhododendron molle]|uniref:Uncharacterized protein n=1 Tax=Rhododendron molle TaxID=49168 RepID=A0ACC0P6L8_RHOML|nr:hypothetical protein RHMOL_Rhmol04G0273700 [Rhododendron molle]
MRRWTAFQGQPKSTPNSGTTEDPTYSSLRCGKWLPRSTKIQRSRGDKPFEVKPPRSQPLKRKQSSPSPTSSANSCIGKNNVQLDAELKTVTAPDGVWDEIIKANNKNEKLRNKGIDHFELLDELLHNSMATGAFTQPGTLGATTSDEERAMFGPPKSIRGDDSMYTDSRKRKSDGSGASISKQVRGQQMHAYESVALANERKAGYYEALTINRQQSATPQFTIKETIAALDDIQGIVANTQYWKAYGLMMGPEGPLWREGFLNHQPHNRIAWVSQLD